MASKMRMGAREENFQPNLLKGAMAGAAAGLIASWVMNRVYGLWNRISDNPEQPEQSAERGVNTDPATIAMVNKLSQRLLDRELTGKQARVADLIGHYMIGTGGGLFYGAFSEAMPELRAGTGAGFGTAFFLLGEEIAVPFLGLSPQPWRIPAKDHAVGLLAHLAYGITMELSRRLGRNLL